MKVTWAKLKQKAFTAANMDDFVECSRGDNELKRVLSLFDLVCMGIGCIVGAGVFVLTGEAAHEVAGPSIVVSYIMAGIAAFFAGICYSEFASEIPVSGSAYIYVDLIFGEMLSWLAASSIVAEYILSVSSVAKGFSGYLCTLLGMDSDALIFTFESTDEIIIDIGGTVLVVLFMAMIAYGVRESFTFNNVTTAITVCTAVFIMAAASGKIDTDNYTPFFPEEFGHVNTFRAASVVFFAYVGFDGIATAAEEAKNPTRDVPLSILMSLVICTCIYLGMSLSIVGMIPYDQIDVRAPFSAGFSDIGWEWASRMVSFGALCGILTSIFGMATGLIRLLMVFGRVGFLPPFLAKVNERTRTPVNATMVGGFICALLTLVLDIEVLTSLVSMGSLFAFFLVCAASLWRRYAQPLGAAPTVQQRADPVWVGVRMLALVITSLLEGIAVDQEWPLWTWLVTIVFFLGVVLSFVPLPILYKSKTGIHYFQPVISCLGVLTTIHLIVALGTKAYIRFFAWEAMAMIVYCFYSVHNTKEDSELANVTLPSSVSAQESKERSEKEPLIPASQS